MDYLISLSPVLLFLLFLVVLDSYKLVKLDILAGSIGYGVLIAMLAYSINNEVFVFADLDLELFAIYFSPAIEEILKVILIIFLLQINKIGMMVDGAILGFAAGAGFAVTENIFYIMNYNPEMINLALRGLGTAIMHGGCTAIAAVILVHRRELHGNALVSILLGLFIAIVIHAGYNFMIFNPLISTAAIIIVVPGVLIAIFMISEKQMQEWLELELDSEAQLLGAIKEGEFSKTKAGKYILSIRDRFSKKVVFDLICFIQVYLELSIKAKGLLLLQESGFPVQRDKETDAKLEEFEFLKNSIGPTALLALAPIVHLNSKNLWKLKLLES